MIFLIYLMITGHSFWIYTSSRSPNTALKMNFGKKGIFGHFLAFLG